MDFPCVGCGALLPEGARFCNECGLRQTAQPSAGGKTALGVAVPEALAAAAALVESKPTREPKREPTHGRGAGNTLGGIPASQSRAEAFLAGLPSAGTATTKAAPTGSSATAHAKAPSASSVAKLHDPSAGSRQAPAAQGKGVTLVGVPAPPWARAAEAERGAEPPRPMAAPAPSGARSPAHNRPRGTMAGIARPGVAPTHEARPVVSEVPHPEAAVPQFPPTFGSMNSGAPGASVKPKSNRPTTSPPLEALRRSWFLPTALIAAAVVVLVGTGWLLVRMRVTAPPMEAQLHPESAPPRLVVACPACPSGASLDFGAGRTASWSNGQFVFDLARADLHAGPNVFHGRYSAPAHASREIDLKVDVPFLVDPSLQPLERGEPAIDVVFSVGPTVEAVELELKPAGDGAAPVPANPVRLSPPSDRRGAASLVHRIDVPPADADGKPYSVVVDYRVLRSHGTVLPGSLRLAVPYAPLRLGAPGRRPIQTADHPELIFTGRTAPSATVWIGEALVPVDKDGLFRAALAPSGPVRVRAFGPKLAVRELEVSPVRVRTWNEAERVLAAEAKTSFEEVSRDPDAAAGKWTTTIMKVVKVAAEDSRMVAVGEARCSGQGACPAVRVLLPASNSVGAPSPGDVLSLYGIVVRGVSLSKGMGTAVEIDASFVRTLSR